jgi:hypothetical protein
MSRAIVVALAAGGLGAVAFAQAQLALPIFLN